MGARDRISASRLALGAMLVSAVLFGAVCSVNSSGLAGSPDGGAGAKGSGGTGGHAGATGSGGSGRGGSGSGGIVGTGGSGTGGRGSGGVTGTGGIATGGTNGTGGSGTGGTNASGGTNGTGGNGTGGTQATGGTGGTGGIGGTSGTGGTAGGNGTGGTNATGGTGGTGGTAGGNGTGGLTGTGGVAGAGGTGGVAGAGGHGGAGGMHPPSCSLFPSGSSMTLSDGHLHCYWAHGSQLDWASAEAFCENEGGKLVSILSSTENMGVLHLATQAGLFANTTNMVFIGANDGKASNDRTGAGDFTWVTGETWNYENWHSNQPDGTCTGCGLGGLGCSCDHWAAMGMDGTWYDRTETPGRAFICEAIAP